LTFGVRWVFQSPSGLPFDGPGFRLHSCQLQRAHRVERPRGVPVLASDLLPYRLWPLLFYLEPTTEDRQVSCTLFTTPRLFAFSQTLVGYQEGCRVTRNVFFLYRSVLSSPLLKGPLPFPSGAVFFPLMLGLRLLKDPSSHAEPLRCFLFRNTRNFPFPWFSSFLIVPFHVCVMRWYSSQ